MENIGKLPSRVLQEPRLCLGMVLIGLILLQIHLSWKVLGDLDHLIIQVLFWLAVCSLVWQKRASLVLAEDHLPEDNLLEDNLPEDTVHGNNRSAKVLAKASANVSANLSASIGAALIALVILKSLSLFWYESDFLHLLPLGLGLGLALLASGVKGLGQYGREGLLILTLAFPTEMFQTPIDRFFHVQELTAFLAAFGLYYAGVNLGLRGNVIDLPWGSVEVAHHCTGISAALLLLKLAVLFMVMFPTTSWQKWGLPLAAIGVAFVMSLVRVTLLTVMVQNREVFDYWHGGGGSQIFSTAAILGFGLVCRWVLRSVFQD